MAVVNFGNSNDKQNLETSKPGLNVTGQPGSQAAPSPLQPGSSNAGSPSQTSPKGRVNVQSLPPANTPGTPQEAPAPRQILPTPATPSRKEVIPLVTQPPPTTATT